MAIAAIAPEKMIKSADNLSIETERVRSGRRVASSKEKTAPSRNILTPKTTAAADPMMEKYEPIMCDALSLLNKRRDASAPAAKAAILPQKRLAYENKSIELFLGRTCFRLYNFQNHEKRTKNGLGRGRVSGYVKINRNDILDSVMGRV